MTWPIVSMVIAVESDIVAIRQRARLLAELLAFDRQDQTRIATAVSEIARNAFSYAGGGRAEFLLDEVRSPQLLLIRVSDQGPGIADLDAVLEGRYQSQLGMGMGIVGARRLLDHFEITSGSTGTTVELGHELPAGAARITRESLAAVVLGLSQQHNDDPLAALREQNVELLQSLEEIRRRQEETERLNLELAETNRGVVALYAELDERAEQLRRASDIKSRFLSHMSHEFRTPLNSILALNRLLLDGVDGEPSEGQRIQLGFIRKSAQELLELVNDLLDLAKVEAGKVDLKLARFTVAELFGGLRGALKPLRHDADVDLIFEPAEALPPLHSDEGKVAQVLRNFISNALKFTEKGQVRVAARYDSRTDRITFSVTDTGIGIAPCDHKRVFEEFLQVDGALQRRSRGTGLGLPLSLKLAEVLRGEVRLESEPGQGSTFSLTIPVRFAGRRTANGNRKRVLLIDDDETFRYVVRKLLADQLQYEIMEAVDGEQGLQRIREAHPDVIVLDLQMPRLDGFEVLRILRSDHEIDAVPVIISTSVHLAPELLARLPAGVQVLPKDALSRERLAGMLSDAIGD